MIKKLLILVVCTVALLITCRPLFQPTLFFVHDYLHVARIAEAVRGLEAGHFPVRWSQAFNFGFGMPLFSFYAPLPSLFGAGLVLIGLPLLLSFKLVYMSVSLFTMIGAYFLGKTLYNRLGGVLLAILFTLMPYRAVNLYVRGALSEAWGMAFYPWILLGLWLIIKKNTWGIPCLALSIAGLALSHNLSFMIFLPLALVWGGALALIVPLLSPQSSLKKKSMIHITQIFWSYARMGIGILLGIGIAAFYLIPAYLEKNLVQVEKLTTSYYFNYHLHFLYLRQFITNYWGYGGSAWGPEDGMSFFLGFSLLFGIAVSGLFLGLIALKLANLHVIKSNFNWLNSLHINSSLLLGTIVCLLSGLLGVVALLMTTEKTVLLWDAVELMRFIQFPWRFLSAASIFLSLVVAFVSLLPWKKLKIGLVAILILLSCWGAWYYFWPSYFLDHTEALYYGDSESITQNLSSVLVDYVPSSMALESSPVFSIITPETIDGKVEVLLNRPQEKVLKIVAQSPQIVSLNLAWFAGWQAYLDGSKVSLEKPFGTIKIAVPSGEHTVSVVFTETPIRQASNVISLLSISILLGYGLYREMRYSWLHHK